MPQEPPYVIGVSGASGSAIAHAVLVALKYAGRPVALVVSAGARRVAEEELGESVDGWRPLVREVYDDADLGATIASGSSPTRGMAVVPCSSHTLSRVALGMGDSLIARAAHVHLKERRRLVLVPREAPLSTIDLRHLTSLSEMGVVILPASPAYYTHPKTVDDMTEFIAGKVLDQLDVPHTLYQGWEGMAKPSP